MAKQTILPRAFSDYARDIANNSGLSHREAIRELLSRVPDWHLASNVQNYDVQSSEGDKGGIRMVLPEDFLEYSLRIAEKAGTTRDKVARTLMLSVEGWHEAESVT